MSNISELRTAVFDYLNIDGQSILDTSLDLGGSENSRKAKLHNLFLVAANNARKRAERKHDFSFADVTVLGSIPADNTGLGFNECYISPRYWAQLTTYGGGGADALDYSVGDATFTGLTGVGGYRIVITDQDGAFEFGVIEDGNYGPTTYTGYARDSAGADIPAGTYNVWLQLLPSGIINPLAYDPSRLVKIKTVQATWFYDDDETAWRPIRFTTQKMMSDMLIEHLDRRPDSQVTLDEDIILIQGKKFFTYPTSDVAVEMRIDVNRWMPDYKDDNDTDEFLENGFEYMMWACVVEMNRMTKTFVVRQDGNLPPPDSARNEALEELIKMDIYQDEENQNFRLHYGA